MKDDSFPGSKVRHGTTSGYTTHQKLGEAPCPACRTAKAAYNAKQRATPENTPRYRDFAKAKNAARTRLVRLHPDEYRRLYEQAKAEIATARALEALALAEDPTVPDEFVETR